MINRRPPRHARVLMSLAPENPVNDLRKENKVSTWPNDLITTLHDGGK